MAKTNQRYTDSRMRSKKVALCGVLGGLAVVILYAAGITGVGTFAGPIAAAAILIPLREEFGPKTALTAWLAVALLSFFMMPDREMSLLFLVFGWYPVCIKYLYKIKSRALRILAKLGIYGLLTYLVYGILCTLLGIDADIDPAAKVLNFITLVMGAGLFLILDIVYVRLIVLWNTKWRRRVLK